MIPYFLRLSVACSLVLGCSGPSRVFVESNPDSGAPGDTSPSDTTDTAEASVPGALGATCKADSECASKLCLTIGRCSKACNLAGSCPNSTNWTCVVLPGRGPMCDCDVLSMTDVPCNGIDDNCDGKIDEGSNKCGDVCVNLDVDPKHCGGCDKPCPGAGVPNGEPTCAAGKCGLKCAKGFDNCDSMADNGCEADLKGTAHCGTCGNACKMGEACAEGACKPFVPVDVTILLGVTGSTLGYLATALPEIKTKLVTPLLAIPDVMVGVSYTAEFPNTPYGGTGDRPFQGGGEPMADSAKVLSLVDGHPKMLGGDASDGMIEALGSLSGLPVHPASLALTCSAGRTAGGCWRAGAVKVIVLFTDDMFHNGPSPSMPGALHDPYVGITPAPQDWTGVLKAMQTEKILLLFMSAAPATSSVPTDQHKKMLVDLAQPATDLHRAGTAAETATAADAIVARIKALRGGL